MRGDRVVIYLYKSPAAIAAIFGVMQTGHCTFCALITSHELYQKLSGSSHHECPMNANYFIDNGAGGCAAFDRAYLCR
jgi:hypothetical protein